MVITCPWPPQVLHDVGVVPGLAPEPLHVVHDSNLVTSMSFSMPNTASLKSRSRSYRSSSPCIGLFRVWRDPLPPIPPKNVSNRSKGLLKSCRIHTTRKYSLVAVTHLLLEAFDCVPYPWPSSALAFETSFTESVVNGSLLIVREDLQK